MVVSEEVWRAGAQMMCTCFWNVMLIIFAGWGDEIILATRESTWVFGQNEKRFAKGKESAERQEEQEGAQEELPERGANIRNRLVM
jgi:hypothetical protein